MIMRKKEELIKACKEWFRRSDRPTTMATFKHAVEWADEHPKSPWISVKERMPKDGEDVIFNVKFEGAFVGIFEGVYNGQPWWKASDHNGNHIDMYNVNYWMPIPELPKGGEQ